MFIFYIEICVIEEKFTETTPSVTTPVNPVDEEIKKKIDEYLAVRKNIPITESIKNIGILAKRIQDGNNFVFPGNLTVEGKLTVKESIEIPDVIDFGKKADDGRRRIQFGNPENPGDHLDIAMNKNHIRDTDTFYCNQLAGYLNTNGERIIKIAFDTTFHGIDGLFAKNIYSDNMLGAKNITAGENITAGRDFNGGNIFVNGIWTDLIHTRNLSNQSWAYYRNNQNYQDAIHVCETQ